MDDIFEVLVDAAPVAQGSVPGVSGSPFADFGTLDGVSYTVSSTGPTDGSTFDDGITATAQFSVNLTPGSHTIEFFIGDERDTIVDSALVVDNVLLTPLITLEAQAGSGLTGEDQTATAAVTDGQGQPLEAATVEFNVTDGPNTGASGTCSPNTDCTTDASGQVSFAYAGGEAGSDTIQACFVDEAEEQHCTTVVLGWLAPTPTSTSTPISTPTATITPAPGSTPTLTSTATATATATPMPAPAQLPDAGGTPLDGGLGPLSWFAAVAFCLLLAAAGGFRLAQRR